HGRLTLVASGSEEQSVELFRKMIYAYNVLGRPVSAARQLVSEIEFSSGSRVVALPNNPDTVRSKSGVSLLVLDEASRISDDLIVAVLPMILASQGRLIMLSTPCGQRGFFYEQWINHDPRWERIAALAPECPRFKPEDLEEQRRLLGERGYAQECLCQFLHDSQQVFSLESIDA